jgi:hypothetical protein
LINLWEVEYWEIEVITFIVECSLGRKQIHYIRAALSTMNSQALVAPNYHPKSSQLWYNIGPAYESCSYHKIVRIYGHEHDK